MTEEIAIVIQIKTFTFWNRLNSFFFKPPKAEEISVDCENSVHHFIFWSLFSNSCIQRIAYYNAGLRFGPKTKVQRGDINALYRPDSDLLSLLGSICSTHALPCWFPWDCNKCQGIHACITLRNGWLKYLYLHELYLSKPKVGLKRYLYYG